MALRCIKSHFRIFSAVVALSLVLSIVICGFGCGQGDPSAIAADVAKKWTAENIDRISKDLTGMIVKDNPLLKTIAASTLEGEISKMINWSYSAPEERAPGLYSVITTAYSDVEFPVMGTYRVSLSYDLTIDTEAKQVQKATPDINSFSFVKQ